MQGVALLTGVTAEGDRGPIDTEVEVSQKNQAFKEPELALDGGPKSSFVSKMSLDILVRGAEH